MVEILIGAFLISLYAVCIIVNVWCLSAMAVLMLDAAFLNKPKPPKKKKRDHLRVIK